MRPNRSAAARASPRTASSSRTSVGTMSTSVAPRARHSPATVSRRGRARAASTSVLPRRAKPCAAARPIPLEAPVRTTTASPSGRFTRTAQGRSASMLEEHSPGQHRPLGGYALLTGTFLGSAAGFATWMRTSGRQLPETVSGADLALVTVATHKMSRLVAKDRVTSAVRAPFTQFQEDAGPSEVEEAARGTGMRRAIGELLICPYCLGLWIAAAFIAGLAVAPRPTRWVASVFTTLFGSDVLQIAYAKIEPGD